jgi:nucleoside-diphosphate-sugar epimerase
MKTLVTGGSGYLGKHLRDHFNADDLSRRSGYDVLKPDDVSMVADYDLVIHLAAILDKSDEVRDEVFHTNVEGTISVLKNVRKDAAFIFASTKDVYGRFADNYSRVPENCPTLYCGQTALEWSKLIAERYVEYYAHRNNFRGCIFRLSTVFAPPTEDNDPTFPGAYAEAINTGQPIRLPDGGAPRRDLLHVNDLAGAIESFSNSVIRHGLYNLGGGPANALSLAELVAKLESISGLQAVIDHEHPLPQPAPFNYVSDIGLVRRELGWEPKIDLDEGLKTLFR